MYVFDAIVSFGHHLLWDDHLNQFGSLGIDADSMDPIIDLRYKIGNIICY